ncbi:hypothetical protein DFH09DRAFT_1042040 [Mycena vulgaris]|nr:hypothetical protein DFH09DRAFT_1042040 [Mycena vulgaris]
MRYIDVETHGAKLTEGKFEIKSLVHCECRLLMKIHNSPTMPYIGVSKPSCAFCDLYFSAYRDATKSPICTRDTHGQTAAWTCPALVENPMLDSELRKQVSFKLLMKIQDDWYSSTILYKTMNTVWSRRGYVCDFCCV